MERSVLERIDDLEHDNNMLRSMQADLQVENTRLAIEWEKMAGDVRRLCRTVDDFVGRFSKVQ
jgi:hypothetical protein